MIYLIGGPARCGKSTLAKMIRKETDGNVLSGDAYVQSLQENLRPEWVPDIYDHVVAALKPSSSIQFKLNRLRRRDEEMWQFYEQYIKAASEDAPGDDILLEGNIWPDYLELFSLPHKAVFLVDTSPVHIQYERLIAIRGSNSENNWMTHYSNKRMKKWAEFNLARSELYVNLCKKQGYNYFDIKNGGIAKAQAGAFEYLLKKEV